MKALSRVALLLAVVAPRALAGTTTGGRDGEVRGVSVLPGSGKVEIMIDLQGAALVGRDVIVPGNMMDIAEGIGQGGFELTSPADNVKVEVLNAGGHVIDTMQLGAETAGRHSFDWDASKAGTDTNLTFRVTATSGATTLSSTSLMRDTVTAVSTSGDTLMLDLLRTGSTPYASIKAFN